MLSLKFNREIFEKELLKKKKRQILATDKEGNFLLFRGLGFRYLFKSLYLPKYLNFFRWVLVDWIRGKQKKLFGVWLFCGLFGEGKTISAVSYALDKKKEMPDIHIYTNFNMPLQDGRITNWKEILDLPHRSIVILDEIQNTFSSSEWQKFPVQLLTKITQCRKKQLMVIGTAQVYSRVTKQIREVTQYVVQCSNIGGLDRYFKNHFFHSYLYDCYLQAVSRGDKAKIQPFIRKSFIADDDLYSQYDTSEFVKNIK